MHLLPSLHHARVSAGKYLFVDPPGPRKRVISNSDCTSASVASDEKLLFLPQRLKRQVRRNYVTSLWKPWVTGSVMHAIRV